MKKKHFFKVLFLLPVIMVALLLSSFTTVASATEVTADDIPLLRVENELAQAGKTVVIEVKTENNPGILNALLTLSFDDELTLIDIQEGDALSKLDFTPPGKNSEGTYYSPCNFLWDAIDDADSTNGTILKLTFLLPEDAAPGTIYDIELSYVSGDIADGNLDPIEFDIINGYVEVLDYTPGDVNGDGRHNGTDVTLVRRYITGGYGVNIDPRAADVNDDGRINGTDVTLIRRFITGGYGVVLKPSHGCFEHNLVKVDAVPATCTVDGHIAYWQCSSCYKLYADAEGKNQISTSDIVDEANGHTEVVDSAVVPTCTTTGLTEGKHCSVCNEVIVAQTVVPANDHTVVTDSAVAATCTTTGLTEGKHCSVCKTVIVAQTVVPTIDHEYTIVVTSPNCLEKGYTTHTCHCGDSYIDSYVDALGHTEVIDSAVAATCTTTGLTEGKHCSVCHVVIIAQQKTDKLGHSMQKTEEKDPTCTDVGNIAYWTCANCNKVYSDANGNTEITLNSTIIAAKGHTFADIWDYDAFDHWHPSTCGHTDQVSDKVNHNILSNGHCSTNCGYIHYIQLDAPVIEKVEYDVVHWEPVDNAAQYKVFVNGDFYATTDGDNTSLALKNVKNQLGEYLSVANYVSIRVQALGSGRYMDSQKSSEKQYYYVSETQSSDADLLEGYKIGFGYNLIEDEYLNPADKASGTSVLNINKLFTVGKFTPVNNSTGVGVAYSYSSIDEFVSHSASSLGFNGGVKVAPIGSLKLDLSTNSSTDYRSYKYVETFVFYGGLTYKNLEFTNLDLEELRHCLGDEFVKDIKRESVRTANMSDEQLLDYIYSNYGTHAILGVVTGGSYVVRYTIMTNEESIAQKAKAAFAIAAEKNDLKSILNINFGLTAAELSEEELKISGTKSQINFMYRGSTGGMCSDSDEVSSAVNEWSGNISSDNDVAVMFTNNGAIALSTLISFVDTGLGNAYEAYINERANALYHELYDQYTHQPATLPVEVIDNVLYIDLSSYQNGGTLGNAYHPNLRYEIDAENEDIRKAIFTVYPTMMGKRIDKIVIKGAFDQYNELIDGFSIKLADTWNRDITIVIDNLGVVPASDKGFIDISKFNCDLTVEYTGINAIKVASDKIEFYSSINGKAYNFTLKLNDGETIDLTTAQISSILTLPKANRNGYTFDGWRDGNGTLVTDEDGRMLSEYVLNSSMITLEATWTPKNYSITLNNEGATTQGSTTINEQYEYIFTDENGNEITSIVIPQKVGYSFEGYYLKVSSNNSSTASGETLIIDKDGKIIVDTGFFNENTTIYALWKPNKYVVTMVSNGTDFGRYYVVYGEGFYSNPDCTVLITKVSLPSRTGYSFNGFLNDNGEVIINANGLITSTVTNDYKTISSDISIYADWSANSYTIVYNSNGGTGTMASVSRHYDDGLSVGSNKFTRVGYTFKEWNTAKDGSGTKYSTTATNNLTAQNGATVTLYARWTPVTYTIEFNANGGSGTMSSLSMTYDVAKNLTSNAFTAPYGKAFAGWKTQDGVPYGNGESVKNLATTNGAKVVLYAQWTDGSYEVKFDPKEGNVSQTSKQVTYDAQYGTLPVPTRTGYTFNGWYDKNGTLVDQNTKVALGETHTLTAAWVANTYTVTYNANGGSGSMAPSTFTYDKEGALSANAFTRNGWFFAGWDTKSDGTGDDYANKATIKNLTPNGNVILYAIWERETYEVTFDANGGSVGTNTKNVTFTYAYGDLPTPTREHYRFLGWYTQKTGGTKVTKDTEVTTYSKHTLYAHWERCEYIVTFNTNGGTAVNQAIIAYGSPVIFSNYTTTRAGYTFDGWYTDSTFSNKYSDNYANSSNSNLVAYAKWFRVYNLNSSTSNVSFTAENSTISISNVKGVFSYTWDRPTDMSGGYVTETVTLGSYWLEGSDGSKIQISTIKEEEVISVVPGITYTLKVSINDTYYYGSNVYVSFDLKDSVMNPTQRISNGISFVAEKNTFTVKSISKTDGQANKYEWVGEPMMGGGLVITDTDLIKITRLYLKDDEGNEYDIAGIGQVINLIEGKSYILCLTTTEWPANYQPSLLPSAIVIVE